MFFMNKIKINYLVDVLLLLAALSCMFTGMLKLPVLSFIKIHTIVDYAALSFVHDLSGVALLILAVIHVLLHLDWIICMTKSIFLKKEKCKVEKK